jgi:hypothetical protein
MFSMLIYAFTLFAARMGGACRSFVLRQLVVVIIRD